MRRLIVIALLVVGCNGQATATPVASTAASAGAVPSNWVAFTAPDDSFSVGLPRWPAHRTQIVARDAGPLEFRYFESKSFDQETTFSVGFTDFSDPGVIFDLDAYVDGALAGAAGATLEQSHAIDLDGVPGRDYTFHAKGELVRGRVYLSGARLFVLFVVGSEKGLPNAEEFFASFVIR